MLGLILSLFFRIPLIMLLTCLRFYTWTRVSQRKGLIYHSFALQGENPKKPGSPHNVRLYSIASTRYGDFFDGKTASLCVRRAVYYDPETGKEDPSKSGVCSNYLCDSKPGDKVKITGKTLLAWWECQPSTSFASEFEILYVSSPLELVFSAFGIILGNSLTCI